MEDIRNYLISVTAAAMICSILLTFFEKKSTHYAILQMLCGVFMVITMVSPLIQIRLSNLELYFGTLQTEADAAAKAGADAAGDALAGIIKSRTETYILDKASSMGLTLQVEVTVNVDQMPQPSGVRIIGAVAPYEKRQLQSWITDTLGIAEDDQLWM